jgi:hypothetical protein
MTKDTTPRKAYSYQRFSSPEQASGSSIYRQTEVTEQYCRDNGLILEDSCKLHDHGVSAFRGRNSDVGNLSLFLDACTRGRVHPNSVLVLENCDRLSRDEVLEALGIVQKILKAGVEIHTLRPHAIYTSKSLNDIGTLFGMLLEFYRAHAESERKSELNSKAWQKRRKDASEGKGTIITSSIPAWLGLVEKKFVVNEERAEIVRWIFNQAKDLGTNLIIKSLNERGIPTFGRGKFWSHGTLTKLLHNTATIGIFQPTKREGNTFRKQGTPIEGYYPPILSEGLFYEVQTALTQRFATRGRTGKQVSSLFSGLIVDAKTGDTFHLEKSQHKRYPMRLVRYAARCQAVAYQSFPYEIFERCFLEFVKELRPVDFMPSEASDTETKLSKLSGDLTKIQFKISAVKQQIEVADFNANLFDVLGNLEKREKQIAEQLQQAKAESDNPATELLGEIQSTIDLVDNATTEQIFEIRTRIKSQIRRLVSKIEASIVVVNRNQTRCFLSKIHFRTGGIRPLLIRHDRLQGVLATSTKTLWVGQELNETDIEFLTME